MENKPNTKTIMTTAITQEKK